MSFKDAGRLDGTRLALLLNLANLSAKMCKTVNNNNNNSSNIVGGIPCLARKQI